MNVDALSLALAQITYQIKNLSKNNFKSSLTEISNLVHEHGFEAERHFYRILFSSLELSSIDETTTTRPETIQWTLWIQELPNLLSKTNFVTLICYAVDNALSQKLMKISTNSDGKFLSNLCQMFQLNFVRELLFLLALKNSTDVEMAKFARDQWKKRSNEFLQTIVTSETNETGLTTLNIESVHAILTEIHRNFVDSAQYEIFLEKIRKDFPTSFLLQPILQNRTNSTLTTSISNPSNGHLADLVLEMGYDFTSSMDDCRNALIQIGLKEFSPSTIARIFSAMIRTHSNLNGSTRIFDSNGTEMSLSSNEKSTWNVENFLLTIQNLFPTLNWKDVVKEFDHPAFLVCDRQGLLLLTNGLRRVLPAEQFVDQIYSRWNHVEGQLSWITQSIYHPDIFCLGDFLIHGVSIDCLKHPIDDSKDIWTWRSLNLIETLLRIADNGLYTSVFDLFKQGIPRAGELIFLGLLQLQTIWTTLKQELLQLIIPTFVLNSPNGNVLLNAMWNSPHHTNLLRITFLTSLADWYNRANENEQQQRLGRVLEIVQDLKALLMLLNAQPITFILDLACLASRRGYLKLDKWLTDKFYDHQDLFIQTTIQYLRKKAPQLLQKDDFNAKNIANIETIHILLSVLQLALPSLTNGDLIQEIQTMIVTAKHLNSTRPPQNSTSNEITTNNSNSLSTMNETSDVDLYFKRLYSKTTNPPAITVEEFLDVLTKCKDSTNSREKEIFLGVTKNLFDEYKYYFQYPERELLLNAQLFGGLIDRGLFQGTNLINGFKAILDGLKKPVGSNLWNFAVTVLDRCKARAREQPTFIQTIRLLPTYHEIPSSLREYFDLTTKNSILPNSFDPIRTLTPTGTLSNQQQQQQQQATMTTSPHSHLFQRMNSTPSMTTSSAPYSASKEAAGQKGPSLNQNADIGTLISDPSYNLVRIKPPPSQINDKIAFTFNNLSFSNLPQKSDELKETLRGDEQLWKWVAQYLVLRRVSIEPNFHSLYAGFLNTINMTLLYETVLSETHRNIKILLLSDKQLNNIRDRSLLKNLGHWLGLITIGRNKPILATDLEMKSLIIEAFHMGSQELLYVIPFVAKILESCSKSKIFQQPNPWLMGIMSVLAEMHGTQDFKLNLKFEIEVLCKQLEIQLSDLPIHNILMNREYFEKISKQLTSSTRQPTAPTSTITTTATATTTTTTGPIASPIDSIDRNSRILQDPTVASTPAVLPVPKYKLSDFKPSIFQSLNLMLEINPNIVLFRQHPHLKTYIHTPIEQAINESFQTVQRSLKVATSAAETIVRKDFHFNPDEQQLRTSARNMVAYLSSGLVLITARAPLQEQIQSYIKTHFLTVLGISQSTNLNVSEQATSEMIQQAALEIATANIELCCCLLQRITIGRAIQFIDQRLANDIDNRQRCRAEGRQLPTGNANLDERLPEQIRLHYGPLSSHQLAIYEDFVHFIPGFKPNDSEKRDIGPMDESVPSVWDRLISEIDQTIQTQQNQTFGNALQRLLDSLNLLRTHLQNQASNSSPQAALANVLNIILCNFLEHYTYQSQIQDNENFERFKTIHMNVLKLLIEIRLHISVINKQLTKSWLECSPDLKFNIYAVSHLMRNRLLDIRQIDSHVAQLIDSGNNSALHFAVNFLRTCVIEQASCVDTDISNILDSLHRISLIGKQPAEAVRDLLEIIRLNYTSSSSSNTGETNETPKSDKLATTALSVISNGLKYLSAIDDIETATIVNKAKHILSDWITLTMTQTNRINQQQAFQEVFNQMNIQGILRSDDSIAKFLRTTIQLCVNSVYDLIRQAQPISSTGNSQQQQQPQYARCHQGIDSLCRFLYLLTIHSSDNMNFSVRIHLINRMLGILAALCYWDHEEQGEQFHPLAYQRIILNLFQESTANASTNSSTVDNPSSSSSTSGTSSSSSSSSSDHVMYYIYLAFTNCLHLLRPQRAPAFAFAWLEIVAHRTFLSRFLLSGGRFARQIHNMYALLLVDALRLVAPFIRSGENTPSFQTYYKGILKTFMLLLHDFPEFLCEHYYEFCDCLPLISHQLRNVILSSFPKHIRCPDPFKVNIKIEMLNDISIPPSISFNYSMNIQPAKFKHNLDSYLRTRSPVTFLSELRSYLQQGSDPGSHYNIRMLNALVLYVATQALATLNNRAPLMSSITHTAHMDIFQNLAVDLDTEGRYLFLNAMANHLRYPNTHTHYFSYTILYLFAEANSEALQEQIVRVLLERLVANRPHPWGLLVTFLELVRNPHLKLWSREFMSISPDVKRLLSTLTQGFPQFPASPMTAQASTIVKP